MRVHRSELEKELSIIKKRSIEIREKLLKITPEIERESFRKTLEIGFPSPDTDVLGLVSEFDMIEMRRISLEEVLSCPDTMLEEPGWRVELRENLARWKKEEESRSHVEGTGPFEFTLHQSKKLGEILKQFKSIIGEDKWIWQGNCSTGKEKPAKKSRN